MTAVNDNASEDAERRRKRRFIPLWWANRSTLTKTLIVVPLIAVTGLGLSVAIGDKVSVQDNGSAAAASVTQWVTASPWFDSAYITPSDFIVDDGVVSSDALGDVGYAITNHGNAQVTLTALQTKQASSKAYSDSAFTTADAACNTYSNSTYPLLKTGLYLTGSDQIVAIAKQFYNAAGDAASPIVINPGDTVHVILRNWLSLNPSWTVPAECSDDYFLFEPRANAWAATPNTTGTETADYTVITPH